MQSAWHGKSKLFQYHLIFPVILLIISTQYVHGEQDCLYNKCRFRTLANTYGIRHEPCLDTGTRQHIRDVECNTGVSYHICCLTKVRQDVQKSRQEWFRKVTQSGHEISSICTKRILCEQACKDGLEGDARTDYPEVLAADSVDDMEYVKAYQNGENQACYGLPLSEDPKSKAYDARDCEVDCHNKYESCQQEVQNSVTVLAYYESSRAFHKLGMWSFNAYWLVRDGITQVSRKVENVKQAIKHEYKKLLDRMTSLKYQYERVWLEEKESGNRRKRDTEQRNWNDFLLSYNKTDPALTNTLIDQVSLPKFNQYIFVVNETLNSYDFGVDEILTSESLSNILIPFQIGFYFSWTLAGIRIGIAC